MQQQDKPRAGAAGVDQTTPQSRRSPSQSKIKRRCLARSRTFQQTDDMGPLQHVMAIYQLDGGASRNFYEVFYTCARFRAAIAAARWCSFGLPVSSHDLGAARNSGVSYRIIYLLGVEFGGGQTDGIVETSRPVSEHH